MKIFTTTKPIEIINLLTRLNFCHDGSIRKICFLKNREIDKKDGSLVYPFENISEIISCDVEVELILNSYNGAKKDQIIILRFNGTKSFAFTQNEEFDYSDIHEIEVKDDNSGSLNFTFYGLPNKSNNKIAFLLIKCLELKCIEK